MLTASFLYSGYSDYFQGHSCTDNDERSEHLLYAYYGRGTTLRDIVDQLVDDSYGDLEGEVTDSDVRAAIMAGVLNDEGRTDYESGALAECSKDFADANRLLECPECGHQLHIADDDECAVCGYEFNDDDYEDYDESPVFIVLLDYER